MRDHGGNLDEAIRRFGAGRWLDLSTGINAVPYPLPRLSERVWSALPTAADIAQLESIAATAYGTQAPMVALAGAQAAIQLVPRLKPPGRACVVGPTYNEHAAALCAQGWRVETIAHPADGAGAGLVTVVNPNNPDGRQWQAGTLYELRGKVGLLIVDESFADTEKDASVASLVGAGDDRIAVLRSFGKFYGLAGLRLGFAITGAGLAGQLRALAGPWAVSGPAIAVGCQALADKNWQQAMRIRLARGAKRLDTLAVSAGWRFVGGTSLFRTYDTGDARAAQNRLARGHIWSRIFPYSETWLRLGLPGTQKDWTRLEQTLASL